MRILVVTQYYWPENFRVNDLTEDLVKRGHQVTVLTGVPNYPSGTIFPEYRENSDNYNSYKGVEIVRVPIVVRGQGGLRLVLNYLSYIFSGLVFGLFKLRKQSFDSIFVFEPSPITVGLPAIAFRYFKKAPLIFWVLDLWPETLEAVGVVKSKRALSVIGRLVSYIYNHCDLILGQSRSFLPHIKKNSNNISVEYFPSWADDLFQSKGSDSISSSLLRKSNQFNIVFTGNIGEAQDFPAIIQAVEILNNESNIHWTVVGDGRMLSWLEQEIEKRGLKKSITLAGPHPIEKMPDFFRQADTLLVSLKDEPIFSMTIPGKLQAYLMAGKPILAMLNGEGANIVNEAGCGVTCCAGDGKGLATAVQKLRKMAKADLVEMGQNGIKVSKREFNREKLIGQLESWMLELHEN
jgi:colanic acid biosynthesis glycosyl transferase WcaI